MTMILFTGVGQMVRMDMFLILCLNISLFCFYQIYRKATTHDWLYALLFFGAAGLGTLAKGPIGLGLPGLIIMVFLLWKHLVRRDSPFDVSLFRRMHVITGSVLYLAIVLAWFIPAVRQQGWEYAYLITIRQNLGRVVDSFSHARPWYFYLYTLPWITLPWFPFLISAVFKNRSALVSQQERDAVTFLWIWVMVTFLFFTGVSGKLEIYLLPLFPATAILIGRLWWEILSQRHTAPALVRYLIYPAYILGGLLAVGGIALIFISQTSHYLVGAEFLLTLGMLIILTASRHAVRALFVTIWSFTPLMLVYGIFSVVPVLEQEFTLQPVIQDLSRLGAENEQLGLWQSYIPINYFLPGRITLLETPEEKQAFFSANDPVYCLARKKHLEDIKRELKRPVYVLSVYRIDNTRFVLVSQHSFRQVHLQ